MFSSMDHFGSVERNNLVVNLVYAMYKKAFSRYNKYIVEIAREHAKLVPGAINAFRYHGVTYGLNKLELGEDNFSKSGRGITVLHSTLHGRMAKYHVQLRALREERQLVRNYLSQLVLTCRNHADVKFLMPDGLWQRAQRYAVNHAHYEPTLDDSDRARFLEKYGRYEALVLKRLFMDVVLN